MERSMKIRWLTIALLLGTIAIAQQTTSPQPADPTLTLAADEIGRALILRCFCSDNTLKFDPSGHPEGALHTTDWTLAAVNLQKVARRSATLLEFEAVRVAIRYAPDRHEFDRHPLPDDKMRIQVADPGTPAALARTLDTIFSEGIDHRLQASMPLFWQHYFNPQLPWPTDDLTGTTIYVPGADLPNAPGKSVTAATASKKSSAGFTPQAIRDHVQGSGQLRIVVDPAGLARRIAVVRPIGYGLDARAAESLAKWRFTPATLAGHPVPAYVLIQPDFTIIPTQP
jgi:hypothetical protein